VNAFELRRALLAIPPPDELGATRRSWRLARAAFDEREPTPWPQRHTRGLVAAAVAIAALAAVVSPPGRAVIADVREALGTEKVTKAPQPRAAAFALPAEGRVLVTAPTGVWIVRANGSKRRLGDFGEASWSAEGMAVASTRSRLAAFNPTGEIRWTLARPRVHDARWSPGGSRIAYLSGSNLRVVAANNTGDRRMDSAAGVAPAWRPGEQPVLAYVSAAGVLTVRDPDTDETLWTSGVRATPAHLEWSADGRRLVAVVPLSDSRFALTVYDEAGRRLESLPLPGTFVDAAFAPDDHRVALVRRQRAEDGETSELLVVDANSVRRQTPVFSGRGSFSDVAWSPGARWLLLGWQSADQWLFLRSTAVEKVKAVSSLAQQFDPGGTGAGPFPRIEGWCCGG
jgi:dipeptidyl aminopeptidase/acylaminoacyl peptidase